MLPCTCVWFGVARLYQEYRRVPFTPVSLFCTSSNHPHRGVDPWLTTPPAASSDSVVVQCTTSRIDTMQKHMQKRCLAFFGSPHPNFLSCRLPADGHAPNCVAQPLQVYQFTVKALHAHRKVKAPAGKAGDDSSAAAHASTSSTSHGHAQVNSRVPDTPFGKGKP